VRSAPRPLLSCALIPLSAEMDHWRVAVLGDGGVGKTALAVQVSLSSPSPSCAPFSLSYCPHPVHIELLRGYVIVAPITLQPLAHSLHHSLRVPQRYVPHDCLQPDRPHPPLSDV
jgi:hypothetical protein